MDLFQLMAKILISYCTVPYCMSLLQTYADAYIGVYVHVVSFMNVVSLKNICVHYFNTLIWYQEY